MITVSFGLIIILSGEPEYVVTVSNFDLINILSGMPAQVVSRLSVQPEVLIERLKSF